MKIYLASSWRNTEYPEVLALLRSYGHDVYDFRNPPGRTGFSWQEVHSNKDWREWSPLEYLEALKHPAAIAGFKSDYDAMKWADAGVLLLPCGRSAHLELGWMAGAGKFTLVITREGEEPELMAKLADHICLSANEAVARLRVEQECRLASAA